MAIVEIAFYFLSVLTIVSAAGVVLSNKPITSILLLIFTFFCVASHFLLLSAEFLAFVQIIVYAGAIMVLFLFVVMLLNLNKNIEPYKPILFRTGAIICGGLLMMLIIGSLKQSTGMDMVVIDDDLLQSTIQAGKVKTLGRVLFDEYLFPFEVVSILFLTAMVGSVLLGKKDI